MKLDKMASIFAACLDVDAEILAIINAATITNSKTNKLWIAFFTLRFLFSFFTLRFLFSFKASARKNKRNPLGDKSRVFFTSAGDR